MSLKESLTQVWCTTILSYFDFFFFFLKWCKFCLCVIYGNNHKYFTGQNTFLRIWVLIKSTISYPQATMASAEKKMNISENGIPKKLCIWSCKGIKYFEVSLISIKYAVTLCSYFYKCMKPGRNAQPRVISSHLFLSFISHITKCLRDMLQITKNRVKNVTTSTRVYLYKVNNKKSRLF